MGDEKEMMNGFEMQSYSHEDRTAHGEDPDEPKILYEVIGSEMQIVNILLDPRVRVEVSPGAMMHHGPSIYAAPACTISCGRFWTGESNLQVTFENHGHDPEIIGLTPIYPAKVVPLHLADGNMTCRKNSYMCGVGDVKIGFDCDCNPRTNCVGGLGMVRQKLTGKGIAFIQAGGTVLEKTLGEGESIYIDQMSLVAWSSSIKVNVSPYAGVFGCFTQCCGGESCYMMKLTGMKLVKGRNTNRVVVTSMNFHKWHRTLAPHFYTKRPNGSQLDGGEDRD